MHTQACAGAARTSAPTTKPRNAERLTSSDKERHLVANAVSIELDLEKESVALAAAGANRG